MKATDFKTQGAAMYGGYGWMTRLAEALDVNVSTVHRYAQGLVPIPRRVELALDALRASRLHEIAGSADASSLDPTSAGSGLVAGSPPATGHGRP